MLWCAQKRKEETEKGKKGENESLLYKNPLFPQLQRTNSTNAICAYSQVSKTVDFKMSLKKDQKNLF